LTDASEKMKEARFASKMEELKRQHELTAQLLVCALYKRHDQVPLDPVVVPFVLR
jgi:hypothetical protein